MGNVNKVTKGMASSFRAANVLVAAVAVVMAAQATYYWGEVHSVRALSFSCALTLLVIGIYVLYRVLRSTASSEERAMLVLFVVMLSCMGICYLYAFPPSTVPDEVYHFWAAYQLSNDLLFIDSGDASSIVMRASDADFFESCIFSSDMTPERFAQMTSSFELLSSDTAVAASGNAIPGDLASNPFQDRLLPAMGLALGRLLGLGSVITYYLGRLFNLAGFIVMAAFSVKLTPMLKKGFMVVALLPITMHLAASYSYDAFILGMSLLLTALCLRAIRSHGQLGWRMIAAIAIVVMLLAPCKVIYTLIAGLIFFIPESRFATRRQAILFKTLVPVGAFAMIFLYKLPMLTSMVGIEPAAGGEAALDVRGDETGHYWTLTGWLSHPGNAFMMLMRTLIVCGDHYAITGLGGWLGWFDESFRSPGYLVVPMLLVLLGSSLRSREDDALVSPRRRAIIVCIVAVGWLAVMMSMLTGWTFDTEGMILGVQGRYLLPFFPMLLLAIRPKALYCDMRLDFWLPYSMVALSAINLARIMSHVYM